MSQPSESSSSFRFELRPAVTNEELNGLFAESGPHHTSCDFASVLARSLTYVCAYYGSYLIGFVNVAWDGGAHAILLDPTVRPEFRRRGIGTALVQRAASAARKHGVEWLHLDYEPQLEAFYRKAGFGSTRAGLLRLQTEESPPLTEPTTRDSRLVLVALLTVRSEAVKQFRQFENRAATVMTRYEGRIERTIVIGPERSSTTFREVHIVTFPNADAFAAYHSDPELESLAPLREAAVVSTELLQGEEGPVYIGDPHSA